MKIFYDVDTQNDFMNKDGALYVPEAESIKPNLKMLTQFAVKNYIPIVGSADRHFGTGEYRGRELELQKWGGPFPDHCMNRTLGQRKISETRTTDWWPDKGWHESAIYINNQLREEVNEELLDDAIKSFEATINKTPVTANKGSPHETSEFAPHRGGIYFEKQSYDVFTNPAFAVFLDLMNIKEAVVYGVATDYCVKAAVLGMQKKGIQCYVVEDAIKGVNQKTTQEALEEMVKANFVTTEEILRS